ncbi:Hypothetical predicted protein [Lecanosticta acicola]|uniref:Uncharacterized protein n=1 Tax=Lecanosticta acicola TaxID=111012 RepID=A0AAI8YZM5_9PEZI|nr:Hypothetical predicted protein [Lecanosticta acicola]
MASNKAAMDTQLTRSVDILRVPSHLLRAAYLIGKIPFRSCKTDPRVSYTLYVPEKYKKVHEALQRKDLAHIPPRLPLVVNVHGTRRDATGCRDSLITFADAHGVAILAPLFPAAMDNPLDLDSYKFLRSQSLRSDAVMLDILNEVSHMFPGVATDPIILVGFSGGAQFAHRFMYLHPERIAAVAIAAPGSVTKLESRENWPEGIGNVDEVFPGQGVDLEGIRRIGDVRLSVGAEDRGQDEEQLELQRWLAERASRADSGSARRLTQPQNRLEILKELQVDWMENGIEAELIAVPDVGHSYQDLIPSIVDWLKECQAVVAPSA